MYDLAKKKVSNPIIMQNFINNTFKNKINQYNFNIGPFLYAIFIK